MTETVEVLRPAHILARQQANKHLVMGMNERTDSGGRRDVTEVTRDRAHRAHGGSGASRCRPREPCRGGGFTGTEGGFVVAGAGAASHGYTRGLGVCAAPPGRQGPRTTDRVAQRPETDRLDPRGQRSASRCPQGWFLQRPRGDRPRPPTRRARGRPRVRRHLPVCVHFCPGVPIYKDPGPVGQPLPPQHAHTGVIALRRLTVCGSESQGYVASIFWWGSGGVWYDSAPISVKFKVY